MTPREEADRLVLLTREEHMEMLETALRLLGQYLPQAVPLVKADGSLDRFDADAWANDLVQRMGEERWQAFRDRLCTVIERAHQHGRLLEGELLRRGMIPAVYVGLPRFNGYKRLSPWWPNFQPGTAEKAEVERLAELAHKTDLVAVSPGLACDGDVDL